MAKLRFYPNAMPNNSMDVRAKQRLFYRVAWFPSTCVVAVSPHVISIVMLLVVARDGQNQLRIKLKRRSLIRKNFAFPILQCVWQSSVSFRQYSLSLGNPKLLDVVRNEQPTILNQLFLLEILVQS